MVLVPKKRRWFQFGLRTMLLLPVLVGATWWWCTWPERTAQRFHQYLAAGDVESARLMMPSPTQPELDSLWRVSENGDSQFNSPRIQSRSLADWVCSSGEFDVSADQQSLRMYFGSFVASRGLVRPKGELGTNTLTVYRITNLSAIGAFAKLKGEFNSTSPARIIVDPTANSLIVDASQESQSALRTLLTRFDQEAAKTDRSGVLK